MTRPHSLALSDLPVQTPNREILSEDRPCRITQCKEGSVVAHRGA